MSKNRLTEVDLIKQAYRRRPIYKTTYSMPGWLNKILKAEYLHMFLEQVELISSII